MNDNAQSFTIGCVSFLAVAIAVGIFLAIVLGIPAALISWLF